MLESKRKGIFALARNLIFFRQIRTAGMGTYAAHGKVNTNIDEIVIVQCVGVACLAKLFCGKRIHRAGEGIFCCYTKQILYRKVLTSIMTS